jgi:CRISPR-associated endonuclease/helicase Cas3
MNVLFVSQCHKNALKETRRILDQFAERRGDRTWQTSVTQQGLDTICKLLRKTARKNTAVACHWIHGKDHSELLWIVGDTRQFNEQGAVPTNITRRNILRTADENDWHTQEDIRLLTELAALLHDIGKANDAFQNKLTSATPIADAYRHEWVSLRMLEAFVNAKPDDDWLMRLSHITPETGEQWLSGLKKDGVDTLIRGPFRTLTPFASVIGWLIVSHHRLPLPDKTQDGGLSELPTAIPHSWCGSRTDASQKDIVSCWKFKKNTPFVSVNWCSRVRELAQKILARPQMIQTNWLENPYVLHLSRLGLVLADHYFSSQLSQGRYGDKNFPLYANTYKKEDQRRELNQRLDEHIIGVQTHASRIIRSLPYVASQLPRIARHKGFSRRSKDDRFRWQNHAYDLAVGLQQKSQDHGFFGVNMASTGCGKTLANGRIMYGLSNPQQGARFNIALGLRTLTLQTGDAYRNRMGLGDDAMAVLVGGGAIRDLHEKLKEDPRKDSLLAQEGTESSESLMPDLTYVHFEGVLDDGPINQWLTKNTDAKKLLSAPVLVCTIDHLMPATECRRGGHQIPPMLRLMSSDLILDEPDDFDIADLPALARLVNWAGMLGSRVLLSSATLPPAIINGLFQAYAKGRECYQKNRGQVGQRLAICCAWVDEFSTHTGDFATAEAFEKNHDIFVTQRINQLKREAKNEQRRKATIQQISIATNTRENICIPVPK